MRRKLMWSLLAVVLGIGVYAGTLLATPANAGFTPQTLAMARFDAINVSNFTIPADLWQARLKTHGQSDVFVQNNTWQLEGSTGWHTHPGHSLILVTAGEITAYDSDDPTCTPRLYTRGMGFVDEGGDHAHVLRNEGTVVATTIAVQMTPAGTVMRRIDAPAPAQCPVSVN